MGEVSGTTVSRVLREVARYLQVQGENPYRVRAYELAAERVAGASDLSVRAAEGTLEELSGIGQVMAGHITEILRTGQLTYHQQLRRQLPEGVLDLFRVPSLGPKKIALLWEKLGVSDLSSLEIACREGRLRGVRGLGVKTEERLLEALAQLRADVPAERPIGQTLQISEALRAHIEGLPTVKACEVAGAIRRFCELVDRMVLLASAARPEPVLDAFAQHPRVQRVEHRTQWAITARLDAEDLLATLTVVPPSRFAGALVYQTGSATHLNALERRAEAKGFRLHWDGLYQGALPLVLDAEEDVYSALELPFLPPEVREGDGEIGAALSGRLPGDLIATEQVRGVVHSHSTWSDGRDTLEDMALAAKARGLLYLTVTDHSPTAFYAGGLKEEALLRQWEEIDALNEKLSGIRLLKGIESDILEDGGLDFPDRLLEQLEVVIGSIHVRHKLDEDGMTRRVLRAFDHPKMQIWGHATGRLLGKRDPVPLRMEEVLDKAAEKGVVVEVNGSPARLDLKAAYVRKALERGLKLVVSADAHSTAELRNLDYAVRTARKGWARTGDVLNTRSAEGFLQALRAG